MDNKFKSDENVKSVKSVVKQTAKLLFLFLIGGSAYYLIEVLYRGYSHYSMFILGGICFVFAGLQNEYIEWEYPFWKQVLRTEAFVLIGEFITGCIVNLWLGMNVWDYSNMPFNLLGQVSLLYAILFIPLCALAIILDDYIRYWFFREEKPHYNLKFK